MKPLFLLGRTKRSADYLEPELAEFESRLKLNHDDAMICGDLVLWPVSWVARDSRKWTRHCHEFWLKHRAALETGVLTEFVIGEIGQTVFSASETGYIDRYEGAEYRYGDEPCGDDACSAEIKSAEDWREEWEWDDGEPGPCDPYGGRLFWTVGVQEWFETVAQTRDDEGRPYCEKLLIIMGRESERQFLDTRMGAKLRERLGKSHRLILKAQGWNASTIAFEHYARPRELFHHLKSFLPPRQVKDFMIMEIGPNYSVGDQPLSLFSEWAKRKRERPPERSGRHPSKSIRTRVVPVELVRSRRLTRRRVGEGSGVKLIVPGRAGILLRIRRE